MKWFAKDTMTRYGDQNDVQQLVLILQSPVLVFEPSGDKILKAVSLHAPDLPGLPVLLLQTNKMNNFTCHYTVLIPILPAYRMQLANAAVSQTPALTYWAAGSVHLAIICIPKDGHCFFRAGELWSTIRSKYVSENTRVPIEMVSKRLASIRHDGDFTEYWYSEVVPKTMWRQTIDASDTSDLLKSHFVVPAAVRDSMLEFGPEGRSYHEAAKYLQRSLAVFEILYDAEKGYDQDSLFRLQHYVEFFAAGSDESESDHMACASLVRFRCPDSVLQFHCVLIPMVDVFLDAYEAATRVVHYQPLLMAGKSAGCNFNLACFSSPKHESFEFSMTLLNCIFTARFQRGGEKFTEYITRNDVEIPQKAKTEALAFTKFMKQCPGRHEQYTLAVTKYGGGAWDETKPLEVLKRNVVRHEFGIGTDEPDSVLFDPGTGFGAIVHCQHLMSPTVVAIGVEREGPLHRVCAHMHEYLLDHSLAGQVATRHMDAEALADEGLDGITHVSCYDGHPEDPSSLSASHVKLMEAFLSTPSIVEVTTTKISTIARMEAYKSVNKGIRRFSADYFPVRITCTMSKNVLKGFMWIKCRKCREERPRLILTDYFQQTVVERMITAARGPQKRGSDSCFHSMAWIGPVGSSGKYHHVKIQLAGAIEVTMVTICLAVELSDMTSGQRWVPGDELSVDEIAYRANNSCFTFVNRGEHSWHFAGIYYPDKKTQQRPLCVAKCSLTVAGQHREDESHIQLWAIDWEHVHATGAHDVKRRGVVCDRYKSLLTTKVITCLYVLQGDADGDTHSTRRTSARVAAVKRRHEAIQEDTAAKRQLTVAFDGDLPEAGEFDHDPSSEDNEAENRPKLKAVISGHEDDTSRKLSKSLDCLAGNKAKLSAVQKENKALGARLRTEAKESARLKQSDTSGGLKAALVDIRSEGCKQAGLVNAALANILTHIANIAGLADEDLRNITESVAEKLSPDTKLLLGSQVDAKKIIESMSKALDQIKDNTTPQKPANAKKHLQGKVEARTELMGQLTTLVENSETLLANSASGALISVDDVGNMATQIADRMSNVYAASDKLISANNLSNMAIQIVKELTNRHRLPIWPPRLRQKFMLFLLQ